MPNSNLYSLLSLFQLEINPDLRIDISYKIAKLTLRSQPDICKKTLLNAISDSNIITNNAISIKANTLNSIGYACNALEMKDSAMFYYEKSLMLKKKINNAQRKKPD